MYRVCLVASAKLQVEDSGFGLLGPEDICATILRNVRIYLSNETS